MQRSYLAGDGTNDAFVGLGRPGKLHIGTTDAHGSDLVVVLVTPRADNKMFWYGTHHIPGWGGKTLDIGEDVLTIKFAKVSGDPTVFGYEPA